MSNVEAIIGKWLIDSGDVRWDDLKKQLMELPNDTLADMIDMWVKNYWTNQSYWVVLVERSFGEREAVRLDSEVWQNTAKAQAGRIKQVLQLGNDMRALAITLRLTAAQWVTSGFEWRIDEITSERLLMTVSKCPMGTYRTKHNLPLFPCKFISPPLYESIAKEINENIVVACKHAHPDSSKKGVLCEWEFTLSLTAADSNK